MALLVDQHVARRLAQSPRLGCLADDEARHPVEHVERGARREAGEVGGGEHAPAVDRHGRFLSRRPAAQPNSSAAHALTAPLRLTARRRTGPPCPAARRARAGSHTPSTRENGWWSPLSHWPAGSVGSITLPSLWVIATSSRPANCSAVNPARNVDVSPSAVRSPAMSSSSPAAGGIGPPATRAGHAPAKLFTTPS